MSGMTTRDLFFEPQPPFSVYSGVLPDANGNRWSVECIGQPAVVEQFLREGGLRIEMIPLEKMSQSTQTAAKRRQTRASNKLTNEMEVPRGVQFGVTIRLIEQAVAGPSMIKFEIDPVITQSSSPHGYWLYLSNDTAAPTIICTPTRGSVWLSQYGAGNFWSAYVYWQAGDPAEYTLRGDITRF